jgi:hypothetical protein
MSADRLEVGVTFDERRGGYIGSEPELKAPVVALSLGGLRRRVEALMLPDDVVITLSLPHRRTRPPPPAGAVWRAEPPAARAKTVLKSFPARGKLRSAARPWRAPGRVIRARASLG